MFDYATLLLLWWAVLAVLLLGFTLLNGLDLGLAMLLPLIGNSETERQAIVRVVNLDWTGNPWWLLLGAGAGMAAWPVYAATFSVYYLALLLSLGALFIRPLGFDLRQRCTLRWRPLWDRLLQLAAMATALVFGMAIGNLFTHASFRLVSGEEPTSTLAHLWHPFTLYCGLVSIMLLLLHGAALLVLRGNGALHQRARFVAAGCAGLVAALFAAGGLWVSQLDGLLLRLDPNAPGQMTITMASGAWLGNFSGSRWLLPAFAMAAALLTGVFAWHGRRWSTFAASCITLSAIMTTAGLALFPFVLPPDADVGNNLLLWQAASSHPYLCLLLTLLVLALPLLAASRLQGADSDTAPLAALGRTPL